MAEYHSGDLTRPCPKNIQLRLEGKFNPEMQTAMYRGSFASYALEYLHNGGQWGPEAVDAAGILAIQRIADDIKKEGRDISDSVEENRHTIHEEVIRCLREYDERLGPFFRKCKFIGCELPCRVSIPLPDPPGVGHSLRDTIPAIDFASHIDLLFRAPNTVLREYFPHLATADPQTTTAGSRLCLWDFKFVDRSPTWDYLSRQPQLLLYAVAALEGEFQLKLESAENSIWLGFGEWPAVAWCHLPYLKPFGRKTVTTDDEGVEVEYAKGDTRPLKNIVRWCNYRLDRLNDIKHQLLQRPLMYEAGLFPMIPDPIGCHLCESRSWCPRYDLAQLEGDA